MKAATLDRLATLVLGVGITLSLLPVFPNSMLMGIICGFLLAVVSRLLFMLAERAHRSEFLPRRPGRATFAGLALGRVLLFLQKLFPSAALEKLALWLVCVVFLVSVLLFDLGFAEMNTLLHGLLGDRILTWLSLLAGLACGWVQAKAFIPPDLHPGREP